MGADFILYVCDRPIKNKAQFLLSAYQILQEEEKGGTLSAYLDDLEMVWPDQAEELNLDTKEGRKIAIRKMMELTEESYDYVSGNYRDFTHLYLKEAEYGGLSWGDVPTDACSYINWLGLSGLDVAGADHPLANRETNENQNSTKL